MNRLMSVLFAVPLLVIALAACGQDETGPGVATAGGDKAQAGPSGQPAGGGDPEEQMRRFAKCMRDNGVDMPDPGAGGAMPAGPALAVGDAAEKSKLEKADAACKQYLPNGGEPVKLSGADLEHMRQFAKCMREHGVDTPDPLADGSVPPMPALPVGDADKFTKANEACVQYAPKAGQE
ncbi:hypothetical protein [Micromonospora sp. NBC_01412]|uniref:hypothetical protein n=1 Tax=Micromonospora sp. NBC_01412 TaxID=2903590 RepID=UPI00324E93B2